MTTKEVAERLGKSVRTVQRMVGRGALTPHTILPGIRPTFLFDPADLPAEDQP